MTADPIPSPLSPEPDHLRFDGVRYFIARCVDCGMDIPFGTLAGRDEWVRAHGAQGHKVITGRAAEPTDFVADPPAPTPEPPVEPEEGANDGLGEPGPISTPAEYRAWMAASPAPADPVLRDQLVEARRLTENTLLLLRELAQREEITFGQPTMETKHAIAASVAFLAASVEGAEPE